MKTNGEPEVSEHVGSEEAPNGPDSDAPEEQNLEDLRRFRVRTVPPDVRRQWLLAEPPVISSLELSDTVPPGEAAERSQPREETPSDIRALRAATRKLPRVQRRAEASRGASQRTVLVTTASVIAVALFIVTFLLSGRKAPVEREVTEPAPLAEAANPPHIPAPTEKPAAIIPTAAAPVLTTPPVETRAAPDRTAPPASSRSDRTRPKDAASAASASRKIPPAEKPAAGTDIKTPLFGK